MSKEALLQNAAKLALEALKDNQHLIADNERHVYVMEYNAIIEKIEEALAKQEQGERTWVGLTDEEIDNYFNEEWIGYSSYHNSFKEVMRWQEAKLKEKNT